MAPAVPTNRKGRWAFCPTPQAVVRCKRGTFLGDFAVGEGGATGTGRPNRRPGRRPRNTRILTQSASPCSLAAQGTRAQRGSRSATQNQFQTLPSLSAGSFTVSPRNLLSDYSGSGTPVFAGQQPAIANSGSLLSKSGTPSRQVSGHLATQRTENRPAQPDFRSDRKRQGLGPESFSWWFLRTVRPAEGGTVFRKSCKASLIRETRTRKCFPVDPGKRP